MVENSPDTYKIIGDIENKYNEDVYYHAFNLLLKLLNNIVNNPNQPVYRQFKKTNEAIKTKILVIKETIDLLKELGYVEEGSEFLVYKDSKVDKLKKAIDLMTTSVKKVEEKIRQKELIHKNKELNKLNEEVNERMREEAKKKEELKRLLELDKQERLTKSKAVDSKANDLKFGATLKKLDCSKQPRG
jgi:hypothetical protein